MTQAEPAATVSALGEGPTGAWAVRCPEPGSRRTSRPPPGAATVAQIEPAVSRSAVAGPLRRAVTAALPDVGSIRHSRTPAASQTPSAPTASRYERPAAGSGTGSPVRRPVAVSTVTSDPSRPAPGCTAHQSVPAS